MASIIELTQQQPNGASLPHGARLFQVDLDTYAADVRLDCLTGAEQDRAGRMAFARDSRRYLASRHALRQVLGQVTGVRPNEIAVGVDAVGKPCLAVDGVPFNLSHSGRTALIGVAFGDVAVGVDLEHVRPIVEIESLARRLMDRRELAQWLAVPAERRDEAFFEVWVRKEACLKALGVGLACEPCRINVGETSCASRVHVPLGESQCEVNVYAVEVASGAFAALALADPSAVDLARECFQIP